MKTGKTILTLGIFLSVLPFLFGEPNLPSVTTSSLPQPTSYSIVDRAANSRIWERTIYEPGPNGRSIPKKHQVVELASGLCYQQNGQWIDSVDEIELDPQGGAAAIQGQHQVYFPGDIYQGAIEMVTPEGKQLYSQPFGLSCFDGTNVVLIAELTNSIGELVSSNRIIYPNAFAGLDADLQYTYTKGGFEQDVILRERPPSPRSLGLNPATTRLQLLTEFFNPPQPSVTTTAMPNQLDSNENLDFGIMKMVPGKAFLLGTSSPSVAVAKQWITIQSRQFLVEEIPVTSVTAQLQTLPSYSTSANSVTISKAGWNELALPSRHLAKSSHTPMLISKSTPQTQGFVLDYQTVNGSIGDYTFQSDSTYEISGAVNIYGTAVFEGNAVIKYDSGASLNIYSSSVWDSGPYRPVIFTAAGDNAVGEPIYGSGGFCANPALNFSGVPANASYFRVSDAQQAIEINYSGSSSLADAQFVNCANGIEPINNTLTIKNALFGNVATNFNGINSAIVNAQHVTVNNSFQLASGSGTATFTNCIFANVTNVSGITLKGNHNGFYDAPNFGINTYTNTFYPFQTVGAGSYYLTNGVAFRGVGTTNADHGLLTELKTETTYPPIVYGYLAGVPSSLSPQAQRDTNSMPDLGYHYTPLDYVFGGIAIGNNVTFASGTAVGWFDGQNSYGYYGMALTTGATATFNGTATAPCWIARYDTVQEGGNGNWTQTYYLSPITSATGNNYYSTNSPKLVMNFTKFSARNFNDQFRDYIGNFVIQANNCEFYGGVGGYNIQYTLNNCLFYRFAPSVTCSTNSASPSLTMQNCTVIGGNYNYLNIQHSGDYWPASIYDCAFDGTTVTMDSIGLNCDHNSFLSGADQLPISGAHDVILTSDYNWQSSWLGNFYLPSDSPLIDHGSPAASLLGLYCFTTQTSQTPETNSPVDIGYHYVAVNTSGVPFDNNADGTADYLQAPVISTPPTSQSVMQGSNAIFNVTATGLSTLHYQWLFNGTNISGATSSNLTVTSVQFTNAGDYSVIVSNQFGGIISPSAILTILPGWPIITNQPVDTTVIEGCSTNFNVAVSGVSPFYYQWQFNGTNILDATNSMLAISSALPPNEGNYSVIITNIYGAATSTVANLTVQAPSSYIVVYGSLTNFTFQGDTTYYVANTANLYGTNIFEGGSVIKYAASASLNFQASPIWATGPYRPVVFTAVDDNSVGQTILVSSGVPSGFYANPALNFSGVAANPMNFRVSYARQAMTVSYNGQSGVTNAQFINCQNGIELINNALTVENILFGNVVTNFNGLTNSTINAQNVTINNSATVVAAIDGSSAAAFTNSIFANVTNVSSNVSITGDYNGFYISPTFGGDIVTNPFYPFQAVAGGNYYLTNGTTFQYAGTWNIDGILFTALAEKTTYAPVIYDNWDNLTLGPQASRNTSGLPDLGYHYDPIDYIVNWSLGGNLTFLPGTVISGNIALDSYSCGIQFNGTATQPCWDVGADTVQEKGGYAGAGIGTGSDSDDGVGGASATFTKFATLANEGTVYFSDPNYEGAGFSANSCEFYGGDIGSQSQGQGCNLTNCLLWRVAVGDDDGEQWNIGNCLFWNGGLFLQNGSTWTIENTAFNATSITNDGSVSTDNSSFFDYNAFLTNDDLVAYGGGVHDLVTYSFNWQSSWFGDFYLPPDSSLIDAGSTTADQVGFYHFTTQTNQIMEGFSAVDIGYHYVTTDAYGNPLDSNDDGTPDYIEDANGNGLVDSGETPWEPLPTISITSPTEGGIYFVETNHPFAITVNAQAAPVTSIIEVDYSYEIGFIDPCIGISTNSPFSIVWTNADWINGFSETYSITAVAKDNLGASATDVLYNVTIYAPLAHWTFDDTNLWIGEEGQLPLLTNNLISTPSWSSNAVLVDSSGPARLVYRVVETNGNLNLNCQNGSVLFYFKPDWSSVDQGGTGPGDAGRLIEIGNYNPAFTNGWWSLYLSADGTNLFFATSSTNGGMTNLVANVSWTSNEWYQITLTYASSFSILFVDGQQIAYGNGVSYFPDDDELTNGFRIGSDEDGNNQAKGAFDELETFAEYLSSFPDPVETFWFGIPDYMAIPDGPAALTAWQTEYFGHIALDPNADPYGTGNTLLYAFEHNLGPNTISFSVSFPNQYAATNMVIGIVTVLGGVPTNIAVLVDSTNFSGATWTAFNSTNVSVNLGSTQGVHDVRIGMMGASPAQPTWEETTLILETNPPTISITNPADNSSFDLSAINISGTFSSATLHQITVNGDLAFVDSTNFKALNVPLDAGPNVITAVVEDLTGATNAVSITVIGLTNSDGSMNVPVQLQATPIAGFSPLTVTLNVVSNNAPGTFVQVQYDFNGDGIVDFVTNNLDSVTTTYTNGEYFPTVTIQTDKGFFSSSGGWNSSDPNRLQITVQNPVTVLQTISPVSDPVDLKWNGTNLFVLSGSSGTITKFDTNGSPVGSPFIIGASCSGFDMDSAGNLFVAVTSSNQVWKFNPSGTSFTADTSFGFGGFIGATNGATGTTNGQFNAPFDVAVSPDGGTISVSDSGNDRIQQFSTNGTFSAMFGTNGADVGDFNAPKGLVYDSDGILYIVDSGNNRIVLSQFTGVIGITGTNGTALGQFNSPVNISVGQRGVYVADTGNNRIQKFDIFPPGQFSITPSSIGYAVSTNINQPAAVAAMGDALVEKFYVADTGNNRVVLYGVAMNDPTAAWNSMTNHIVAGDISGAMQYFSSSSVDDYNQDFLTIGTANVISAVNQVGTLTPAYINGDEAEYYFQQTIDGQVLTFKVEFVKENGVWKIFEF